MLVYVNSKKGILISENELKLLFFYYLYEIYDDFLIIKFSRIFLGNIFKV